MKRRLARAAAVGVMVLALAVTPLSAVLSGGHFETWASGGTYVSPTRVYLEDRTGFVRDIVVALDQSYLPDPIRNGEGDDRVLLVEVKGGSCDRLIELVFDRADEGFVISERTEKWGCPTGIGINRFVAISLWSPIDAADVTLSQSR